MIDNFAASILLTGCPLSVYNSVKSDTKTEGASMNTPTRYLDMDEVAARLNVHPRTVARLVDSGKLPGIRTEGGHRRVAEPDVLAYLARRAGAPSQDTIVLVIANQKGGVGKTTLTANLGVLLHQLGARVLIVDLDPQAHMGFTLGYPQPDDFSQTIYDVMLDPDAVPTGSVIHPTAFGPDLAPINMTASGVDTEFSSRPMWGNLLTKALAPVRSQYDYILIDCAPNLGKLTVTALLAGDYVIIPTQLQMLSVRGLHLLITQIDAARKEANARLQIAGAVPMMTQTVLADQAMDQALRQVLDARAIRAFRSGIPFSAAYKDTANARSIMAAQSPRGKHTEPYRRLLAEILAVVGGSVADQRDQLLTSSRLPAEAAV